MGFEIQVDAAGTQFWVNPETGETMPVENSPTAPNWQRGVDSFLPGGSTEIEKNKTADEPWYVTAQKLATALLMSDQQRKLLDLQIERARQGLPPLDVSRYTGAAVQVGIAPQTQNLLMLGGVALLAVLLLRR